MRSKTLNQFNPKFPRQYVTELLAKIYGWTDFAERFVRLRSGAVLRPTGRRFDLSDNSRTKEPGPCELIIACHPLV